LPEQFGLAGTVELASKRDSLQADELTERRADLHDDLDMDNDLAVEQEGRDHVTKEQPQD
jgi:predicted HTH domain antitoxin